MRKILVLRGGALGDFIVTLPALALLRQRWPDAVIELVGNVTAAELVQLPGKMAGRPLLDATHAQSETRWATLYGDEPLPASFTDWLAEFDLVLNFWPEPEGELSRRFPAREGQLFLSSPAMPTLAPAAAHYCAPLRKLGMEATTFFYPWVSPADRCVAQNAPIAIHPGSGSPRKNWPLARWAALCAWLRDERGAELLVVTGEAETAASSQLARFGRELRSLPLPELAAELARCRLFLGHDSGVSHLAAACGVPCGLLFGPTDPAMWAPPAPHVRVLRRGPEMAAITAEEAKAWLGDSCLI
jgi:heptosyltransferase-3